MSGIVAVELVLLAVRISCASVGELSRRYNEVGNNDVSGNDVLFKML